MWGDRRLNFALRAKQRRAAAPPRSSFANRVRRPANENGCMCFALIREHARAFITRGGTLAGHAAATPEKRTMDIKC
jgi:hypothetical protein